MEIELNVKLICRLWHETNSHSRNNVRFDYFNPQNFVAASTFILSQFFRNVGKPYSMNNFSE